MLMVIFVLIPWDARRLQLLLRHGTAVLDGAGSTYEKATPPAAEMASAKA